MGTDLTGVELIEDIQAVKLTCLPKPLSIGERLFTMSEAEAPLQQSASTAHVTTNEQGLRNHSEPAGCI